MDFYYSQKHWEHMHKIALNSFNSIADGICYNRFDGKLFTEQIEHGKTPVTDHFGDLVLIGTGTMFGDNVEYKLVRTREL